MGVYLYIHEALGHLLGLLALLLGYSFRQQLQIHIVADSCQMPVLFRPQDIAGTADLQVPHGDPESRTEFRELPDRSQSLLSRLRQDTVGTYREISVSLSVAPPDPAPQLIQLAQSEPLRIKHDQRVRAGYVQPVLDDGGA